MKDAKSIELWARMPVSTLILKKWLIAEDECAELP